MRSQRQLAKDGYGAQAKNTKEVGTALRLAGATQVRKTVGDREGAPVRAAPKRGPTPRRGPEVLR